MEHEALAHACAGLGAVGALLFLLARERLGLLAGVGLLVAAEAGLAYALVPDAPSALASPFRLALLGAAALAGLVLVAAFVRFPAAATVVLLAAAPFRVTAQLGGEEASLLIPLYVALVGATGALVYRVVRGHRPTAIPLLVAGPAAILTALAAISLLWAQDERAGAIELLFFYLPFATLLAVVARVRPAPWSVRALAATLLSVTGLLAAIGLYQLWTHAELLAKPDVQLANARDGYFRVTSLFQDPSVYGRHLVLGITLVLALLWLDRLRSVIAIPVVLLLAAGLYLSYSQTSLVALFAAVLAVGLVAGDGRARRLLAGTAAVIALAGGGLALSAVDGESAKRFTSDRLPLARITLPVYAEHPVAGVGIGSQPLASRREAEERRKRESVSHTTPLTVAAELGTVGLLAYLVFLLGFGRALVLAWRRDRGLGLTLIGCGVALVVHSLAYGAFFEDPFVWGALGLAATALVFFPEPADDAVVSETRKARARPKPLPGSPAR
jgi:hypothetical protein